MMYQGWRIVVTFQECGTKNEVVETVDFASRDEAERALEALEADVLSGDANRIAVVKSPAKRISFIRQDFRRSRMFEFDNTPRRRLL